MGQDLLTAFCQGEGRRFGGKACEHLEAETSVCRLLRDHDLKVVVERGRCAPAEMVKRALVRHLEKYRDVVDPAEHLEALAFEITARLLTKRLQQGFQIYVLHAYLNRAVYCGVIELLRREDPLVKRQCGNCRHLSLARPYHCQRATVSDSVAGEQDNVWYNVPRNLTDRACEYGFEPVETLSFDAVPGIPVPAHTTELDTSDMLLADMLALLARRASATEAGRAKKRADRQYLVFCQLLERCRQGETHQEAVSAIAADLGVSIKTIQREVTDLKTFFVHEGVVDDVI